MINYEIKSQLAKLLATEDLVVENRKVPTASFDVERRVLTLPMWQKASNTVYDMLVGHEVGHALFTPNDWSYEDRVPRDVVNVTEDARIEKLMKRKYAGLGKTFFRGYKELADQDFFELENEDLSKMNLADRVNLHFKIGNHIDVPFTDEELELVKMTGEAETFADAVLAAEAIYGYCKSQQPEQKPQENKENLTSGSSESETEENESESEQQSKGGGVSKKEEQPQDTESQEGESESDPFEVSTDKTFSDGVESLTRDSYGEGPDYYEVPKLDLDKVINPNSEVHEELRSYFSSYTGHEFDVVDEKYNNFKKSAQREVNYLVKEFEMKKSADAYSRASTSRTGVLDCSKLHTYKYNEDLFKKVTVIPDGKNHGLIFILDWSGSMADCIEDTIKQLYNLIWFCSKVQIPFEVYAFTNSYLRGDRYENPYHNVPDDGKFVVDGTFSLMNILTSKVNKKNLEKQMKDIYRLVYSFRHYVGYDFPSQVGLSGTPLNESLVALYQILPKFKKENGLQKVQVVVLTDGEAHQLSHFRDYKDYFNGESRLGPRQCSGTGYLRNRKTGHTYEIGYEYWKFTDVLLKDLKQIHPDTNFIGIRLLPPREFGQFLRRYNVYGEEVHKKARKEKSYTITTSAYDSYFAMIQSALSADSSFQVEDDASKAKIKSAFAKSLKAKTLNKKVLSQFMDLVC